MKRIVFLAMVAALLAAGTTRGEEPVKLVYPASAALEEALDSSTPAKRATPPIREEEEFDPVTPLGQIRGVLDNLNALKEQNATILDRLATLQVGESREVLGALERGAKTQDAIGANVDALIQSSRSVGAKLDDLKKTTENLRATVEAVQKTAASVETIRTSRWTDFAVVAILALVLIQLAWKIGGAIASGIKRRAAQYQEFAAFIREKHLAENGGNK